MDHGPSNPIIGTILGLACLAGGFALWQYVGKPMRARAAASVKWPVTDGEITRSQLNREEPKRDKKAMFSMTVAYAYTLDGKNLEGHRVWFGDHFSTSDPDHFQAAVKRYPVGTAVKVFYDPADPSDSVLEPGSNWSASIWYLVGIGLMVFGATALASSALVIMILGAALASAVGGSRERESDFDRPKPMTLDRTDSRPRSDHDDDDGIEIV